MENRIYLRKLESYSTVTETQNRMLSKNPYYDLSKLPTQQMREELKAFILHRSHQVCIVTLYGERQYFNKLCRCTQKQSPKIKSFLDEDVMVWVRRMKILLFEQGLPLSRSSINKQGKTVVRKAKELLYVESMIQYLQDYMQPEQDKDIWHLDKLDISFRANPIKNYRTLNFKEITQDSIRAEVKKGIYLNLQNEAIACISKEMTAVRRLSRYLRDKHPEVQSCKQIDRELIEAYLTYLKTEATETKHFHADLNRLRAVLESIGQICGYQNLCGLFLTSDIPPTPRAKFKVYSDEELKRLNAALIKMEEQIARLMIIHQMIGTRISDTLTLQPDCLYQRNGETIIRIRQMKTNTYEKPISAELVALIKKAIAYTKEHYGDTPYIFVNEKDTRQPLQYHVLQDEITRMIFEQDLRDDDGNLFGFGTHLYRHYYGVKLTEMHLDDWTIAKLLGHSSINNVKYYRKMSNQILADDTRKARNQLSEMILNNLDGWEDEYEQIRQDGSL